MEVVLDTNVIVSAAINPDGSPARVVGAWQNREFELVVSQALYLEIEDALSRPRLTKFIVWTFEFKEEFLHELQDIATWVTPAQSLDVLTTDPDDNRVLEAALEGSAEFIVTGDRHLLELREYEGTRIVTPIDFLAELQLMR